MTEDEMVDGITDLMDMSLSKLQELAMGREAKHAAIHFHQEALQSFFTFCHNGGVICLSEVIDISPGNL